MGVFIEEVSFKNYRQYRDLTICFENEDKSKLHVIIAKNGTGKTTFLRAVTWCLYGEEAYAEEDDKNTALPILNGKTVEEHNDGDKVEVSVEIKVKDTDPAGRKFINFRRTLSFTIIKDALSNSKKAVENSSQLSVTTTEIGSKSNSRPVYDQEADLIVDQYFDRMIREYYFFDGENLQNFFATNDNVKDAIFNISQLTLLDNTKNSCENLRKQKSRIVNKNNPDAQELENRKEQLRKQLEKEDAAIKENQSKIPSLEKKKKEAEEILNRSKSIQEYRLKQIEAERREKRISEEMEEFKRQQNSFIQDYLVLLNFYPRIKKTYEMINKKIKDKEIPAPSPYNKEQLKKLLKKRNSKCHCPVCDTLLTEKAFKYIESLIDDHNSVSQSSSHTLTTLLGPLEHMIKQVENYPLEKSRLEKKEKDINDEMAKIQNDIANIHSFLSGNAGGDLETRIKKAERDRLDYKNDLDRAISEVAKNKAYKEKDIKTLADINEQLDKINEKQKIQSDANDLMNVFGDAVEAFDICKNNIMHCMKDEIQVSTWEMFDNMIWKKHTFKNVIINDDYEVSVFDKFNKVMTGSLSATEKMALAYSFTLAIHEASGRNCPLIVDSPLGRVSDTNREKMASALLDVSMGKQIILLFTPDEYSKDVQKVLVDKACSIRKFELSNDENEIKGVK